MAVNQLNRQWQHDEFIVSRLYSYYIKHTLTIVKELLSKEVSTQIMWFQTEPVSCSVLELFFWTNLLNYELTQKSLKIITTNAIRLSYTSWDTAIWIRLLCFKSINCCIAIFKKERKKNDSYQFTNFFKVRYLHMVAQLPSINQ